MNHKLSKQTDVYEGAKKVSLLTVHIKEKQDVLSSFSSSKEYYISEEMATFLMNQAKPLPLKNALHVKIKTEKVLPDDDKQVIAKAIKNYFHNGVLDVSMQIKKSAWVASIMLMVSIIVLSVSFLLSYTNVAYVLIELLEIVGWVFAWECVDIFCFRITMMRFQRKRSLNFLEAKISFDIIKDTRRENK